MIRCQVWTALRTFPCTFRVLDDDSAKCAQVTFMPLVIRLASSSFPSLRFSLFFCRADYKNLIVYHLIHLITPQHPYINVTPLQKPYLTLFETCLAPCVRPPPPIPSHTYIPSKVPRGNHQSPSAFSFGDCFSPFSSKECLLGTQFHVDKAPSFSKPLCTHHVSPEPF